MEWMLLPYRRYADFSGRSRRMEYWMFALFQMIVAGVLLTLFIAGSPQVDEHGMATAEPGALFYLGLLLAVVYGVGTFIPSLAVTVRRLHDQDRTGWWILVQFLPFGGLVLLVFMLLDGTPGTNRFGPDPKGRGEVDVFA